MSLKALGVLAAVLVLAGCAGFLPTAGGGTATLWITRDRGRVLLDEATVPAGQTLMRALRSREDVDTRYGGRFVEGIDGLRGSATREWDWFWFVNGLLGDTSAAEYRLRPGDVAWWDYRDWRRDYGLAVVVGAFPEPFRHGYAGRVRPSAVRYAAGLGSKARMVARVIGANSVALLGTSVAGNANVLELSRGSRRFRAELRTPGAGPGGAVRFVFTGNPSDLLPGAGRPYLRRFSLP